MIVELTEAIEKDIIRWRKAINRFMEKEYGFILRFYPKIEGEDNE